MVSNVVIRASDSMLCNLLPPRSTVPFFGSPNMLSSQDLADRMSPPPITILHISSIRERHMFRLGRGFFRTRVTVVGLGF